MSANKSTGVAGMNALSLFVNFLVLGCGVAIGFSIALLRVHYQQQEKARKYNPYEVK